MATWSGVNQRGKCPAVCSMSTAVKRSSEPNGARCIITGVFLELSSAVYSSFKAVRKVIVNLNSTQLPAATDSVLHHEVELGP